MLGTIGRTRLEPRRRGWTAWDPHSSEHAREGHADRIANLRRQRESLATERDAAKADAQQARTQAQLSLKVARELAVLVGKLNADLQRLKQATVVDPLLTLFPDLDAEDDALGTAGPLPPGLVSAILADDE